MMKELLSILFWAGIVAAGISTLLEVLHPPTFSNEVLSLLVASTCIGGFLLIQQKYE